MTITLTLHNTMLIGVSSNPKLISIARNGIKSSFVVVECPTQDASLQQLGQNVELQRYRPGDTERDCEVAFLSRIPYSVWHGNGGLRLAYNRSKP